MTPYAPARLGSRLGQADLFSGLTSGLAKSIVAEAEPATRRVIKEERTKFAEAVIGGIPWASASAIAALATYYLVKPKPKYAKFLGYGTSAALLGIGSLKTISDLHEPAPSEAAASAAAAKIPGNVKSAAAQAATAVVTEAEPKVRAIVSEERARLAQAAQAGLPLVAVGALAMIGTLLAISPDQQLYKMLGYTASTLLVSGGVWVALENEK
jgi:hypothetical protein